MSEKTLYDRFGGVNVIAMVVDRFSDRIVKTPGSTSTHRPRWRSQ
jgi:hypothetical protein